MFASLLRLFALRPFFTLAILGIPVIVLVAVGLATIFFFKFVFVPLLIVVMVVWVVRKVVGWGGRRRAEG